MTSPAQPRERPATAVAKDARIAWAIGNVDRESFPTLAEGDVELSPEALARVFEDLAVGARSHVLVIDPPSGYMPVVLGLLAEAVTVSCSNPWRAGRLAEQLARGGFDNVQLISFLDRPQGEGRFDAILASRLAWPEMRADLPALLKPGGAAVVPSDDAALSRKAQRLLRLEDSDLVLDDLDLTTYRPLLGDLLVEGGIALRQEVDSAARAARESGRQLGEELIQRGVVREEDLYRTLAQQRQMVFTDTAHVLPRLDCELVKRLPRKYLNHYSFIPIGLHHGRLVVVTTNLDLPQWELAGVFDAAAVAVELSTPTDIKRIWTAIELGFVGNRSVPQALPKPREEPTPHPQPEASEPEASEESRTAGMFEAILLDAVAERASDIHLEVHSNAVRLRFRIDGSLHDVARYRLGADDVTPLVNVVKLAANLDIAERRAPQGGRIRRRIGKRDLDLRVQTQPTLYHENLVIRILPQDVRPPTIEELGFPADAAQGYRRLLREPHGLILVVGATGAGKSTTLYAGLQQLAEDSTRKVITIEDPIEFAVDGIQQTQVSPAVRFHFADAMRVFVREDPDVILVGEIRDPETALETIRAAQTGHLVLATMHCNDTVDAVQRLTDLGMHRNSIASELTAVIAQRLARRICPNCRREAEPERVTLDELFPAGPPPSFRCFKGKGCDRCNGTGARGRIAVVEFLQVGPEIRRAIAHGALVDDLRDLARAGGTASLRDNALALVQDGTISLPELYDVLSAEQMCG
ncbi:MAG: ATPase, T2SS/T4P/T4SS family [Planctomycetota bacterium]